MFLYTFAFEPVSRAGADHRQQVDFKCFYAGTNILSVRIFGTRNLNGTNRLLFLGIDIV